LEECNKEEERIQKVYERRYNLKRVKEIYTFFNPASLFTFYQREKKLLNLLKNMDLIILRIKKFLM